MKYDQSTGTVRLSPDERRNYLQLSDGDRLLRELYPGAGAGKGKNSCVFRAQHPEGGQDVIVKFCRFPANVVSPDEVRKRKRFEREIEAFRRAREREKTQWLLDVFEDGVARIEDRDFNYYVMEEADADLSRYLQETELTLQQKLFLCSSILEGLSDLHEIGIYHRDLKPDNVFFVDDKWKIGDLGFVSFRGQDESLDAPNERIGPTGLMSPEATNKAFANTEGTGFLHDCQIDASSDVYLLGGVFWFILQGNFPIGQLSREDLLLDQKELFDQLLVPMLQHAKSRRSDLPCARSAIQTIGRVVGL
jgi:serine/threonine protein kinase